MRGDVDLGDAAQAGERRRGDPVSEFLTQSGGRGAAGRPAPRRRRPGAAALTVTLATAAVVLLAACSSGSSGGPTGNPGASSSAGTGTAGGSANPAVDQEVAGCPASGGTLSVDLDEQVGVAAGQMFRAQMFARRLQGEAVRQLHRGGKKALTQHMLDARRGERRRPPGTG